MSERPVQPQCDECNHPRSFHGGGHTRCRAGGCNCPRWRKPKEGKPKAKVKGRPAA